MIKKLSTIITIVTFVALLLLFFGLFLNKQLFSQKYGFNVAQLTAVFVVAEIAFNLGIIIMLRASGIFKMTLKQIFGFKFEKSRFQFNSFFLGFFVNRAAAAIPWIYVLALGWRKIPLALTGLILLELLIVAIITLGAIEVRKQNEV